MHNFHLYTGPTKNMSAASLQLPLHKKPRKLDAQRQKEAYERQVKEAERKREMEREKAEKREQEPFFLDQKTIIHIIHIWFLSSIYIHITHIWYSYMIFFKCRP